MSDLADRSPDIAAAREDVQRARNQISDTVAELEARVTAPVSAVKERLDVGRVVGDHPWPSLAAAVAVGALVAATRADRHAASLGADAARKAAEKAREGGVAGARLAREAPSKTRSAMLAMLDGIGAKAVLGIVEALRRPESDSRSDGSPTGLGFMHNEAPAHAPEVGSEVGAPS